MQRDDLIGTTLGNYRIISTLGQGGMAKVYKAYQENLDREVAVKVLPPWFAADRSFVDRFNLEARLVARLSHPNIVTVHDASEQHGHLYIVMQLVDGGTLKHRLDQLQHTSKPIDMAEMITIFVQLASALAYAHEEGIIHRDIKPVNILMDRSGRPILSDFGIAKVLASSQEGLTRPGAGVGTPEYMSPEQCQGSTVDGRADIYALGVVLFEAMTGRTPFRGNSYPALAHSHIYEMPPRPSSLNPSLNPMIEHIILTALMKNPKQRYQRASEMREALQHVLTSNMSTQRYYEPAGSTSLLRPKPYNTVQPGIHQSSPPTAFYPCYHCEYLNKGHMRFCTRCGHALNLCTTCGSHNLANNRFCTKCGQALTFVR